MGSRTNNGVRLERSEIVVLEDNIQSRTKPKDFWDDGRPRQG